MPQSCAVSCSYRAEKLAQEGIVPMESVSMFIFGCTHSTGTPGYKQTHKFHQELGKDIQNSFYRFPFKERGHPSMPCGLSTFQGTDPFRFEQNKFGTF